LIESEPFNPYQPPAADLGTQEFLQAGERLPLPFEDPARFPGVWSRVWAMFHLLFSAPLELFARIPAGEGFRKPLLWSLLLSTPIVLLTVVIALVVGLFALLPVTGGSGFPRWLPALMAVGYPLILLVSLVVGMFLGGLVSHASLWMWGGLRNNAGLSHTLRAQGYFQGFFMLAYLIPILNILVALAGPALLGMGLARLHRTDTWRGVCAAYTPLLLCCLLYLGFILLAVGAVNLLGAR
jgi:hypothetical protein